MQVDLLLSDMRWIRQLFPISIGWDEVWVLRPDFLVFSARSYVIVGI